MNMKNFSVALLLGSTVLLTGCGGAPDTVSMEVHCSSGGGCSGKLTLTWQLRGYRAPIDAGQIAFDTASSTSQVISNSGSFNVIATMPGGAVHSQSFTWVRSGALLVAQSPASVNSWLNQYWSTASNVEIDFGGIQGQVVQGANLVVVEATLGGSVVAGGAGSWYSSGGGGECPGCQMN